MKRPGLTLPELVVSIFITGLVVSAAITAYLTVGRIIARESAKSMITLGSGRILGPLDELLRQGINIEAQYPPSPEVATVTTGTDALVFSVPSLNASGDATDAAKDYITVVRDTSLANNARLLMTVYPDATLPSTRVAGTTVVATNVLDLYFRFSAVNPTDTTEVATTVRLARTENGQTSTETLLLSSLLRNQ